MTTTRVGRAILACLAVLTVGGAPAAGGAARTAVPSVSWASLDDLYSASSANWSGYVTFGGHYSSVSARWAQPAAQCAPGESSTAGFWVGLDGVVSPTVEQIGTVSACVNGSPAYVGFSEAFPKRPFPIARPLSAGDIVVASVSASGRRRFNVSLTDETAGWTFTTTLRSSGAQRSSAEVIAESAKDVSSGGLVPLTNFGVVTFQQASIDGGPIGAAGAEAVFMQGDNGTFRAEPSELSGGDAFSVTWLQP